MSVSLLHSKLLGRRNECEMLDGLLADALAGRSRVAVLRGEAGVGKSALLDYVSTRVSGWHVARAVGIESEMELAYASLHQICAPMLDRLDRLPGPQREALETVFGRNAGPAPDRFLVGLATLTLFAEVAEQSPLICILDDGHWLDRASAQIIGFVARRLQVERVAILCGARTGLGDDILAGLPELTVVGLGDEDARTMLLDNMHGRLDPAVCDQIVAESHGNPLALLELPRTWKAAELAGGFSLPGTPGLTGRIERSYAERILQLPGETRLLVLAAAAEPLGNPLLLHRAAETLGLDMKAAGPAVGAELLQVGARIAFAHPLVRSAAYRAATAEDRRRVHRALAEATDPETDPDRRAWHRARATSGPDEEIAAELERSAGRAQARGGLAAAAAFLERAAALSLEPAKRAQRALAAAEAKQLAGSPEAALALLATAADGPLSELETAMAQRLRGQIALDMRRGVDAVPFLLDAARRLEPVDPRLARETYLEAIRAASISGRLGGEVLHGAAEAARNAPLPKDAPRAVDLLLYGLAVRFTDGYAASAASLKRALNALRDGPIEQDVRWPWLARRVAPDLFEDEIWHALITRAVQLARERAALGVMPLDLNNLATMLTFEGDLDAAEALLQESDAIADATGTGRNVFGRLLLAGFRGDEAGLSRLIEGSQSLAIARNEGVVLTFSEHARAVLHNGLGQYEAALAPAESASARDELCVSVWSLPELIEAAARSGRTDRAAAALEQLIERTRAAGTELALGIEARSRALLNEGDTAEELYREAIDRLSRTAVRTELARAHLLYGEWLRRQARRVDARYQLRTAHDMFLAIGMTAFADRAGVELLATGERVRKRTVETQDELTPQEMQIARLASDGHTNPEIGSQLFLSRRTVEWHLRKVFDKLDVRSRRELPKALRRATRTASA